MEEQNTQGQLNHGEMVAKLAKPGEDILTSMTSEQAHRLHMAVGISGEAGELIDAVKKEVVYGKNADRENIVEELGDLEFYMEGLRQSFGITRYETIASNISKLSVRYENFEFSNQAAQDRADKVA